MALPGDGDQSVIFEFTRIGASIKVAAVDSATGTEVSIVGPASAGETVLRQTALRKLQYMLTKSSPPNR